MKDKDKTKEIMEEITQRERAEQRYRTTLESMLEGCQIIDADWRYVYLNDAAVKHGHRPKEELLGRTMMESYPGIEKTEMFAQLKRCMEKRVSHRMENEFSYPDGSKGWFELSFEPVPEGIFILSLDITERKQAEEKQQTILKTALDGFWLANLEGKFIEVNDSYCEMVGYAREQLLKMSISDVEAIEALEETIRHINKVIEQGYDRFESQHKRKDGKIIDVEVSVNYLDGGEGQLFVFVRDITERKRAEAALKESEEKYKTLVEATSDIIWEADEKGMFTFVSPKIKDILGYEVDEVVGKKRTLDLIPEGEARKWLKRFKEVTGKREPFFGFEIPHLHKNGNQLICETSGIPLFDSAGNFKGFVGIDKDITERRQMQEQLVITDRLASVGELAAGIAHELNNPLTGIIGFSQLLLEKEMPEDIREDMQVVYSEAQRASQVVKNLLTFARKHTAVKEKVNISDIINKVLELRAYEQRVDNIEVKGRLAHDLSEVMADYFQLQQVFLNIIINAEHFMKEAHHKGNLTITTEQVGNKVRASFADDGPGIAKDDLGHLFDPFFTTKEVGKGMGLGLSICHGIIAEHGGRIYAESELGKGATFIVELPIGAAKRKGGAA